MPDPTCCEPPAPHHDPRRRAKAELAVAALLLAGLLALLLSGVA